MDKMSGGKKLLDDTEGIKIMGIVLDYPYHSVIMKEKAQGGDGMNILIIEDQFSLADAMKASLEKEGFSATLAGDGLSGENEALSGIYDIIILDIMLPVKDGFEVLKAIKDEIDTPVIMVTAKSDIDDKLHGLQHGADDYITKPFHMKELIARIYNVLRRTKHIERIEQPTFGDLALDIRNAEILCGEKRIALAGKEFRLMEVLIQNKGAAVSREALVTKIWGYDSNAEYNNVEVYVSFLRKKLRLIGSTVKITAVRGVGYRLEGAND